MSKTLSLLVPVASGALAAAVVVIFMDSYREASDIQKQTSTSTPQAIAITPAQNSSRSNTEPMRLSADRNLPRQTFSESTRSRIPSDAPPSSQESVRPTAEQLERIREEDSAREERIYAEHDRETRDNTWAFQMESDLQQTYQAAFSSTTRFENTDCRSHTCTLVVTWPSLEQAREEMTAVAVMTPCATRLSAPTLSNGEYRAKLWLDCRPATDNTRN